MISHVSEIADFQARARTMIMASDEVFGIPELAEAIFLQLSIRDLLCGVQQTCKQWKAITDCSSRIQQALFFQPVQAAPVEWICEKAGPGRWANSKQDPVSRTVLEHPLICPTNTHAWQERLMNEPAMRRKEASWRRSLITQPPATKLTIKNNTHILGPKSIANGNGVTLGEVLMLAEDTYPSFSLSDIKGWILWISYQGYHDLAKAGTPKMAPPYRGAVDNS